MQVKVDFYLNNRQLLLEGLKTSTLRSRKQAEKIGLLPGNCATFYIGNEAFWIFNHGLRHVSEVGGYWKIWESEGFHYTKPKFKQTLMFLKGKCKLYYYTIQKINTP